MCAVGESGPKGHQALTLHPRHVLCSPQGRVEEKKRLRETERKAGEEKGGGSSQAWVKGLLGVAGRGSQDGF